MKRRRVRDPGFDRLESRHLRARIDVLVIDHSAHLVASAAAIADETSSPANEIAATLQADVADDGARTLAAVEETAPVRVRAVSRLRKEAAATSAEPPRASSRRADVPYLILSASLSGEAHLHDVAQAVLIDRGAPSGPTSSRPATGRHASPGQHEAVSSGHGAPGTTHVPQTGVPIKLMASTMFHRRAEPESPLEELLLDAALATHAGSESLEPALAPALEPELEPSLEPEADSPDPSMPHEAPDLGFIPPPLPDRIPGPAIVLDLDRSDAIDPSLITVSYSETPAGAAGSEPMSGWLVWLAGQLRILLAWFVA